MYTFDNEVDNDNRDKVFDIVKSYFSLDDDSLKDFKKAIYDPFIDENFKDFDNGLRKRIKLSNSDLQKMDVSWKNFNDIFKSAISNLNIKYDNFRSNRILYGKNEIKLTKRIKMFYFKEKNYDNLISFCDDNDVSYSQKAIDEGRIFDYDYYISSRLDEIFSNKLPKGDLQIVYTINFVDYFLSATGDNWSSCLSLESQWHGVYWAGLPGLAVDKNRFMVYITNGDKKVFNDIEVDKMYYRSFGLINENNKLFFVRWYPSEPLNLLSIDKKYKILNSSFHKSKYPIDLLRYKNGFSCYIFQDNTTFQNLDFEDNRLIYFEKGMKTLDGVDIVYGPIFNVPNPDGIRTLENNNTELLNYDHNSFKSCYICDGAIHNDDISHRFNGEIICDYCRDTRIVYCEDCGEAILDSDAYSIDEGIFCEYCYNEILKKKDTNVNSNENNESPKLVLSDFRPDLLSSYITYNTRLNYYSLGSEYLNLENLLEEGENG